MPRLISEYAVAKAEERLLINPHSESPSTKRAVRAEINAEIATRGLCSPDDSRYPDDNYPGPIPLIQFPAQVTPERYGMYDPDNGDYAANELALGSVSPEAIPRDQPSTINKHGENHPWKK